VLTPSFGLVLEASFFGFDFGVVCGWFCLGRHRDRLCIVAAILEAANSGASKTRSLLRANLSFSLLEKYLDAGLGAGFVRVEGCARDLVLKKKRMF